MLSRWIAPVFFLVLTACAQGADLSAERLQTTSSSRSTYLTASRTGFPGGATQSASAATTNKPQSSSTIQAAAVPPAEASGTDSTEAEGGDNENEILPGLNDEENVDEPPGGSYTPTVDSRGICTYSSRPNTSLNWQGGCVGMEQYFLVEGDRVVQETVDMAGWTCSRDTYTAYAFNDCGITSGTMWQFCEPSAEDPHTGTWGTCVTRTRYPGLVYPTYEDCAHSGQYERCTLSR